MNELTQKQVQSLFTYKDGNLYWKVSKAQRIHIGDKAGSLHKKLNYYQIRINNELYYSHRLIFLYHHGYLPKEIDHINGDKTNNHIKNLRGVTRSQNSMNKLKYGNYSSKYKGVSWVKSRNKWVAQISINGKNKNLGRFINENDAAIAYNKAANKYFGKYGNLNILIGDD